MANLLEVRDLRTHIVARDTTVEAVDGVSFEVRPGETVGLVGESGCGKTMTGLSVMGLLPPGGRIVGGSIKLNGREFTTLRPRAMRAVRGNDVAMVFQDPMTSLNPTMTIGEQIAEPIRIHKGVSKKDAFQRAAEVLDLVGMPRPEERLKAFPHQLSGGLRQRVVIAIALCCDPKLLIADEPTTALDVSIQAQILSLLDDLKQRLQMGMILITHDLGVIAGRADRVMVMYAGRIVEEATTTAIFEHMRHPYTEALLESIPSLETDRHQTLYSIPGLPPDLAHPPSACRFAPRCRYVQTRCNEEDPPLGGEDREHPYACFFPVDGPAPPQVAAVARAHTSGGRGEGAVRVLRDAEDLATTTGAAPETLLVLENVVKEYPITAGVLQHRVGSVKAVSDVSFSVTRGETFGLVGESGCGKTTLGRLIVSLEKPDSGTISFNGEEISRLRGAALRRRRRDLQLMFQDPYSSIDPRMRIHSVLREPLVAQHIGSKKEQLDRIRELLGEVGLSARTLDMYPHEFSGGQRQRVGFARSLVLEPRLIVADEPVSALDVSIQSQVLNLMKRLQADHDLTYIVISHDLSVIRYLADRVGVVYLGKLVEIGPADDIYRHPAHPYTSGLLEAIPVADPSKERTKSRDLSIKGDLPSAANPPSGCRFRTRCPRAEEICAEVEPPLRPFSAFGHEAACHFPLETPVEISPRVDQASGAPA